MRPIYSCQPDQIGSMRENATVLHGAAKRVGGASASRHSRSWEHRPELPHDYKRVSAVTHGQRTLDLISSKREQSRCTQARQLRILPGAMTQAAQTSVWKSLPSMALNEVTRRSAASQGYKFSRERATRRLILVAYICTCVGARV